MTTSDTPLGETPPADARQGGQEGDGYSGWPPLWRLITGRLPLSETLTKVAEYAVLALPGADGAGLMLLEEHQADKLITTTEQVQKVEAVQRSLGEGPGVLAVRDGVPIISGSLGADVRWPRFGGSVARMGMHSAISLPLLSADDVVGAVTVYARAKHVFDEAAAEQGERFAAHAAATVLGAQALADSHRLAARLQRSLDERMEVERAVGIIMSRSGVDEHEARIRLIKLSQSEHVKLAEIARILVAQATARARSTRPT